MRISARSPTTVLFLLLATLAGCSPRMASADPWTQRFPDADTVRVSELSPGVAHAYLWLARGPWAVHVLEVDRAVCRPVVEAMKPGPPLDARQTTTALTDGALAAINADFFMLPGGTPVGAHVNDLRVLAGPGDRPIYALDPGGRQWAGTAILEGFVATRGDTVALAQVNRPKDSARHEPVRPGLRLFDEWFGEGVPPDSTEMTALVRRTPNGSYGLGVLVSIHPPGRATPLDGGHVALRAEGEAGRGWLDRREVGDTVAWHAAVVPAAGPGAGGAAGAPAEGAAEAVGGYPLLVAGGRGVYAQQAGVSEAFGEARHPRTAVGWDEARERMFWVVVDGRQSPYSDGMSLSELEDLFLRLGATGAINLDGGGSSAMVVGGVLANRPSDGDGERAVGNALALRGCLPGR